MSDEYSDQVIGFIVIGVGLCIILLVVMVFMIQSEPQCLEERNECYYTYMIGKVIRREVVSCDDTRANRIKQVCVEYATE